MMITKNPLLFAKAEAFHNAVHVTGPMSVTDDAEYSHNVKEQEVRWIVSKYRGSLKIEDGMVVPIK